MKLENRKLKLKKQSNANFTDYHKLKELSIGYHKYSTGGEFVESHLQSFRDN